jgi:cytochrome c peroxidase
MFTDKKLHNIGVISDTDPDGRYDTPTLIEGYRTAPYLHDGRALTLKAVFTDHDPSGLHGKTKTLSKQELDDLVAYLQSL